MLEEVVKQALNDDDALVAAASALHDELCSNKSEAFRVGVAKGSRIVGACNYLYSLSYCLLTAEILGSDAVRVQHRELMPGVHCMMFIAGTGMAIMVFEKAKTTYVSVDENNMGFDKIHAILDSLDEETQTFLCKNPQLLTNAAGVIAVQLDKILFNQSEH